MAVIYLRVSTEEQARRGFSLPSQRDACWTRIQAIAGEAETAGGRLEVKEFVDTFGGDVLERPVLEELRTFVRAHRPAWFICMDPDRFSRSLTAQLLITDEIERAGTRLAFVQHNYEKTAEGRLFYQLRGAIAEFEKAKILERTARGKRRKLKEGRRSNGVAPYGYRHDVATDELLVHEPEARWVRLIFQWVAHEQLTYYQVVRRLRDLGIATKKGGTWREATVAYMLRNTAYVGQMICNRYDSAGQSAYRRLPRAKREAMTHRVRPEADWITAPVPAIIDQATFDAAQRVLATCARRGGARGSHLLSMMLRCGRCGSGMSYNHKHGTGAYVRCNRRFADLRNYADPTRCTMPHLRIDRIEAGVWETVCGWLLESDLHAQFVRAPAPDPIRSEAEIAALEEVLAQKHSEQQLIIRKQVKQLLTEQTADAMLAATAEQIAQLEARLAGARKQQRLQAEQPLSRAGAQSPAAALADTARRLSQLDHQRRIQLVRQLVRTVTVHEDGSWTVTAHE